jgi:hypothetical protein
MLPMNPLFASLGLCVLLAALPAHAATDPLAQGTEEHDAQVIGWSGDGKRFAVRLYFLEPFTPRESMDDVPPCDGYVTHEGNPFRGGLVLLAYERGRLLSTFPIRERERCTPTAEAEKRLEAAKKRLEALGIRLDATGKEILSTLNAPSITVEQGAQAPYTLEYEERATPAAAAVKSEKQRGTLVQDLHVRRGKARQKLLSRKTPYEYSTTMAGYLRTGLDRVWLSPSGTTVVVLGYERVGNMRGGRKSLRLLGVLGWSGSALKPL